MTVDLAGRTCGILMATYDDWRSVAHILPILDEILARRGMKGHVVVVDDSSRSTDGKEMVEALQLSAIAAIDEVQLGSNQGNQRALAIGLGYIGCNVAVDFLVVMDSDNEDKPEDVGRLLDACAAEDGRRIVFAERTKRSEGLAFQLFYLLYKWVFKLATGGSISMGNFCIIPGRFVKRIAHVSELWNHFPISIVRSGLPFTKIPTIRGTRLFGRGKMNIVKLIVHAFSGFTIHADVIAVRILLLASGLVGLFLLVLAGATLTRFSTDLLPPGWTSQMMMQVFTLVMLVLCTSIIVLISALTMRMQPPMIPFHDYGRFVFETVRLYGKAEE